MDGGLLYPLTSQTYDLSSESREAELESQSRKDYGHVYKDYLMHLLSSGLREVGVGEYFLGEGEVRKASVRGSDLPC